MREMEWGRSLRERKREREAIEGDAKKLEKERDLVYLFYGISTYVGYSMPKPSL